MGILAQRDQIDLQVDLPPVCKKMFVMAEDFTYIHTYIHTYIYIYIYIYMCDFYLET